MHASHSNATNNNHGMKGLGFRVVWHYNFRLVLTRIVYNSKSNINGDGNATGNDNGNGK